jgi:predicted DsbA family dithiol-disulfide isomerase
LEIHSDDKPVLHLTLFTDYICPFCYIGDLRLRKLRENYHVLVNFRFLEIHPETAGQGSATGSLGYSDRQWKGMMDGLLEMARQENIQLEPPRFIANSHRALLLAEAAKESGRETFYELNKNLFEAYFLDRVNIGDENELEKVAIRSGVHQSIIDRAWSDPEYEKVLRSNIAMAIQAGVSGTPTFFIGKQRLTGAVESDVLFQAAESVIAEREYHS